MTVRWRDLLDQVGVQWSDQRRYAARGWIALHCPWCGAADASMHLGINEENGVYHCLRTTGHGGRSPYWLLGALGVPRNDISGLLEDYGYAVDRLPERRPSLPTTLFARRWDSFRSAATDREACGYLAARGFWNPARTARLFDLRIGVGRYAARLWFPFVRGGEIIGFIGRAMRNQLPRYLHDAAGSCLYIPRPPFDADAAMILVEGPIDALRLADAVHDRYNIFVAAFCGAAITPDKRSQLVALARVIPRVFVVLDSTVSTNSITKLMKEFTLFPFSSLLSDLQHVSLLPGVDDPGEMSGEEVELWLRQTGLAELTAR